MSKKPTLLDEEIKSVVLELGKEDPSSQAYTAAAQNLKVLMEAKQIDSTCKAKLDPNQVLKVATWAVGLLTILNYEQVHVIAGKAMTQLFRLL